MYAVPSRRSASGEYALAESEPVAAVISECRRAGIKLSIYADLCICQHTTHGHCGIVHQGELQTDAAAAALLPIADLFANAGVDYLMPSGMMAGMVGLLKQKFGSRPGAAPAIFAQSAKFCSALYAPFRSAAFAETTVRKESYQLSPRSANQALREIACDLAEGANGVMVKPACGYLDVIAAAREAFPTIRIGAFSTSGEYMMITAASESGICRRKDAVLESVCDVFRAGADCLVSYFALECAALCDGRC